MSHDRPSIRDVLMQRVGFGTSPASAYLVRVVVVTFNSFISLHFLTTNTQYIPFPFRVNRAGDVTED
jgi:hypothetical protein